MLKKLLESCTPAKILVLGFAGLILFGALLLTLPIAARNGQSTPFLTALFTATSAVCVTGLVVVDTGTHYSLFGQLVILGLIQAGGLGIMTLTTLFALVFGKKINLRERLIIQEALNVLSLEGVVRLVKNIVIMTMVIEGLGAIVLSIRFAYDLGILKGIYYGFFHSISAFCNAGFDLFGPVYGPFSSLTHYVEDPVVSLTVPALIILGGLGFVVLGDVIRQRRFSRLSLHSKLAITLTAILVAAGTTLIWLLESKNSLRHLSPLGSVLAAFFQAVTPRTAGYNTLNIGALTQAAQFLIVILMFIGASPGGTGGGIKTTTFGTLVLAAWSVVTGRADIEVFGRRLPKDAVLRSLAITLWAAALVIVVTMCLTFTEKANFLTVLFETVSAFGTVGLSMGLTPHLSDIGRVLIILTMFAGRVGPLTVMLAIWQQRQLRNYHYPEEKIIVG
ncbi:MAG: TrkH family potassium uptake protein [Thermacetogeniaceae bacterium]